MAKLVNQYSFLIAMGGLVLLMGLFTIKRPRRSRLLQIASVSALVVVVVGYFLIRPGVPTMSSSDAAGSLERADRPILIEVYSNY